MAQTGKTGWRQPTITQDKLATDKWEIGTGLGMLQGENYAPPSLLKEKSTPKKGNSTRILSIAFASMGAVSRIVRLVALSKCNLFRTPHFPNPCHIGQCRQRTNGREPVKSRRGQVSLASFWSA